MWEMRLSVWKCAKSLISWGAFLLLWGTVWADPFLTYHPLRVIPVESRSQDENFILEFDDRDPVFFRTFRGKQAQKRCQRFYNILLALESTGIAPRVLERDDTNLAVTFVPGIAIQRRHLQNDAILDRVMDAMQAFYNALRDIQDDLPPMTLLDTARTRLKKLPDSDIKDYLLDLLMRWERKFLPALRETGIGVVHGDLHVNNMLWYEKRVWLLDYGLCGRGYVFEDIARLSLYGALSKKQEKALLARWFEEIYDDDLHALLDACKVLARFVWVLTEIPRLSTSDLRQLVFTIDPPKLSAAWVAQSACDVQRLHLSNVRKFFASSTRSMKKLFDKK